MPNFQEDHKPSPRRVNTREGTFRVVPVLEERQKRSCHVRADHLAVFGLISGQSIFLSLSGSSPTLVSF
jgi:hypothetical protein